MNKLKRKNFVALFIAIKLFYPVSIIAHEFLRFVRFRFELAVKFSQYIIILKS